MTRLFGLLFVILLVVAGIGYFRGWFTVSTEKGEGQKSDVTISVDKEKIKGDTAKAKEQVKDVGGKVKDKTSASTGDTNEEGSKP